VDASEFRDDLFYRINVFPVHLPSLGERLNDIPLLARALLKRVAGGKKFSLTPEAEDTLKEHRFKGNIRELRNILSRAIVLSDTDKIEAYTIRECFFDRPSENLTVAQDKSVVAPDVEVDLKTLERNYIASLMQRHHGDKEKVASILGISVRSLYRKVNDE